MYDSPSNNIAIQAFPFSALMTGTFDRESMVLLTSNSSVTFKYIGKLINLIDVFPRIGIMVDNALFPWYHLSNYYFPWQMVTTNMYFEDKFISALTHWGQVTHICVGNLTIIGSDKGLSPGRCQAITWNNDGILLIGPLGTNFSEMLIEIHTFSFKKIHLKMSSGKWRPFCLCLNVLKDGYLRMKNFDVITAAVSAQYETDTIQTQPYWEPFMIDNMIYKQNIVLLQFL